MGGRPRSIDYEATGPAVVRLRDGGMCWKRVMRELGLSRTTAHRAYRAQKDVSKHLNGGQAPILDPYARDRRED